jgi:N-carbamoyl-L-amino-acid hydrolase
MVDPKAVLHNLDELRALTSDEQGAQRVAWSPVWLRARAWFEEKLKDLPIEHHYDAAANHWITLKGESEKALVLGSHLDSVPNGGWLDGCLGVLAGLEVLTSLAK